MTLFKITKIAVENEIPFSQVIEYSLITISGSFFHVIEEGTFVSIIKLTHTNYRVFKKCKQYAEGSLGVSCLPTVITFTLQFCGRLYHKLIPITQFLIIDIDKSLSKNK